MKKFTLIFASLFCFTTFLNAQNTSSKTYFDDLYVGALVNDVETIWASVDSLLIKIDKISGETISYTLPVSSEYQDPNRYGSSISLDSNGWAWITCIGPVTYLEAFDGEMSWTEIPIPSTWLSGLIIDQNDKVWASTILGLHEYNETGWIDYNVLTNIELPFSSFTALAVDSQNNKWLGLTPPGIGMTPIFLTKFDDEQFTVFTSDYLEGTGGTIGSIDISPPGIVWMGTHSNGLVKFDGTNWDAYNSSNSDLPPGMVQNVTVEGANIVWLSTESGLTRFDGENWKTFNTDNSNLPSNTINSILIDENTTKWVATDQGLISFAGSALSTSDEQNIKVEFKLFPNPTNDFITLKMPSDGIGSTIEIFNILGKSMKSIKIASNNYKIDISDLANGVYLFRLQTKDGMAFKKFIKQD